LPNTEDKANLKIAIVEDIEDVALVISRLVEVLGYKRPSIFEDGGSIVRAVVTNHESFDAVFMDYRLSSEMNGIESAEIIMKHAKDNTRIVMMSGYDFVEDKADNLGIPFLQKPFSKEQLERVLDGFFPEK
jgi:CheY-like chemotaxis protein